MVTPIEMQPSRSTARENSVRPLGFIWRVATKRPNWADSAQVLSLESRAFLPPISSGENVQETSVVASGKESSFLSERRPPSEAPRGFWGDDLKPCFLLIQVFMSYVTFCCSSVLLSLLMVRWS